MNERASLRDGDESSFCNLFIRNRLREDALVAAPRAIVGSLDIVLVKTDQWCRQKRLHVQSADCRTSTLNSLRLSFMIECAPRELAQG